MQIEVTPISPSRLSLILKRLHTPHINPRLNAIRDSTAYLFRVSSDDPVRRAFNHGFAILLTVGMPTIFVYTAIDLYQRQFYPIAIDLIMLAMVGFAFWLNRCGTIYGATTCAILHIFFQSTLPFNGAISHSITPLILFAGPGILAMFVSLRMGLIGVLLQSSGLALKLWPIQTDVALIWLIQLVAELTVWTLFTSIIRTLCSSAIKHWHQLTLQLEQRVQERTMHLQQLMQRHKDETTSIVHDLNNSLALMSAGIGFLTTSAEDAGVPQAAIAEAFECLNAGLHATQTLADDLRTVALLEHATLPLSLSQVPLGTLVQRVAQQMQARAIYDDITLELVIPDSLPSVRADAHRIERVVANLLGNALKFTKAHFVETSGSGGQVQIDVGIADAGVQVVVRDNGPGMSEATLQQVGQPWLDQSAANGTGMGLGLYLCHGVLALHGGWLHMASDGPGQGTTATIWLPLAS